MLLGRSDLDLMRVAVEGHLQFSEGRGLNLICVLQFLDPVGLLALETRHLTLNLHAFVILLVDAADELGSLLLTLDLLLHVAYLEAFLLLVANHLLHGLGLELLGMLLDRNHLLVLLTFLLQALGLAEVPLGLVHLLVAYGLFLVGAGHVVPVLQLALIIGTLLGDSHLFVEVVLVALANAHDVAGLLLSLLDFLPGLEIQ